MIKEPEALQVQVQVQGEIEKLPPLETERERMWREIKAALRSGEYEQARGALCKRLGVSEKLSYCCLGVMDVVAFNETFAFLSGAWVDSAGEVNHLNSTRCKTLGLDHLVTESEIAETCEQLGTEPWPSRYCARQSWLADLNDQEASFEEIADLVEALGWDKEPVVDRFAPVG